MKTQIWSSRVPSLSFYPPLENSSGDAFSANQAELKDGGYQLLFVGSMYLGGHRHCSRDAGRTPRKRKKVRKWDIDYTYFIIHIIHYTHTHTHTHTHNFFLGSHLQHMKAPRLGVELELQLLAYPADATMPDQSCICDQHCSLGQRQILNPLSKARDQTYFLMDTSWILNPLSHNRNSIDLIFLSEKRF